VEIDVPPQLPWRHRHRVCCYNLRCGIRVVSISNAAKMARHLCAVEIGSGILAAVYAANQFYVAPDPDSELKGFVATVGGIYIIVRGLDNWSLRDKIR
jgi:hypothetical protein